MCATNIFCSRIFEDLIDNSNNNLFTEIAPSPIHGVGVFAVKKIPCGCDPFKLPRSAKQQETVDFGDSEIAKLNDVEKTRIKRFVIPNKDLDGKLIYSIPKNGINSLDISWFLNEARGTGLPHNCEIVEGFDIRGVSTIRTVRDVLIDEELLLPNYHDIPRDKSTMECMICKIDVSKNDKSIKLSCPCHPIFHVDCGKTWFSSQMKLTFEQISTGTLAQGEANVSNS